MNSATDNTKYLLHNTTHGRHNRGQRRLNPRHFTKTLTPTGDRVLRARPRLVYRYQLEQHIEQYRALVASGALEVRTMDGGLVDLKTFVAALVLPQQPPPKEPVDTLANDAPIGMPLPQFIEGIPLELSDVAAQDELTDVPPPPELPDGPTAPMGAGIPDALTQRFPHDPINIGKKSKKGRR